MSLLNKLSLTLVALILAVIAALWLGLGGL